LLMRHQVRVYTHVHVVRNGERRSPRRVVRCAGHHLVVPWRRNERRWWSRRGESGVEHGHGSLRGWHRIYARIAVAAAAVVAVVVFDDVLMFDMVAIITTVVKSKHT